MFTKKTIFIAVMLISFCSWGYPGEKPSIDVLSADPNSRIAVMSVPFLIYQGDELLYMEQDARLHSIIASTSEEYLQEKGYPAFYIGNENGLLTKDEIALMYKADIVKAIKNQCTVGTKIIDLTNIDKTYFKSVYKFFYPVFVCKKANIAAKLLGGHSLEVTIYGFLLDCHTGEITWSNKLYMVGNYNAIDLNLRGARWGHGAMWQVIKTLPIEVYDPK